MMHMSVLTGDRYMLYLPSVSHLSLALFWSFLPLKMSVRATAEMHLWTKFGCQTKNKTLLG